MAPDRTKASRSRADEEEGGMGSGEFSDGDSKADVIGTGASGSGTPKGKAAPLPRGNACSICRRRKLRCDGIRPKCSTCARLNHDCAYGDPVHEKLTERTRELEDRVRLLESELEQYRNAPNISVPSSTASRSQSSSPPIGFPSFTVPHEQSARPRLHQQNSSNSQHSPFLHDAHHLPGTASSRHRSINISHEVPQPFHHLPQPQDSQAFPLPPPHFEIPSAHLQSFPFATSHVSDLMDLINPVSYDADGRPTTARSLDSHASPQTHQPHLSVHSAYNLPPISTEHHRAQEPLPPTPPATGAFNLRGGDYADNDGGLGWHPTGGALTTTWGSELPEMDLLLELTDIFFITIYVHFPLLHRSRFLYSLNHPASILTAPSLALVFAILAIAAPYHADPSIRARGGWWYKAAREKIEVSISASVSGNEERATLSVEMVQALCLLTTVEMGKGDHQRAFLTIGQAVRISAMLGLHRMDEDRIAGLQSMTSDRRLRPPALHILPEDPLLLEECRRTMCTVFVLDRFEAACIGWPATIAEGDIRLLLPCAEPAFEAGTCSSHDNPLWWPTAPRTMENEEETGPSVGSFAWLCRVVWFGGRIQAETYRPSGFPADGPFRVNGMKPPLEDLASVLEMDKQLDCMRAKLNQQASANAEQGVDGPLIMILIVLNCLFLNLHHLRVALGLATLPFNPSAPIVLGSAEYSMKRCLEGVHSIHEIVSQLAAYEDLRTAAHNSRINIFTSFVPYVLYCVAFPAKFSLGDWSLLGKCRTRGDASVPGIVTGSTGPTLPSGDDVFGIMVDEDRLALIDTMIDGLERIGLVWEIGKRFAGMVRGDRDLLAGRVVARRRLTSPLAHGSY